MVTVMVVVVIMIGVILVVGVVVVFVMSSNELMVVSKDASVLSIFRL